MKFSISSVLVCILSILFLFIGSVQAAEYKASLANMPVYAESPEKGVLVDLAKAMAKVSGVPISIVVEPFARSIHNVTQAKTADFHMPLIVPPGGDPRPQPPRPGPGPALCTGKAKFPLPALAGLEKPAGGGRSPAGLLRGGDPGPAAPGHVRRRPVG